MKHLHRRNLYVGTSTPEALRRRLRADGRLSVPHQGRDKVTFTWTALWAAADDGRLTDAQGRAVDFKNTVVIMTSNIGADRILSAGVEDYAKVRASVMPSLQQHFRSEFLNRIDEIIVFRGLECGRLRQIVDLLLEHTRRRLHAQDVTLQVTDAAADLFADLGHQPEFGAGPLRRTIQREADDHLADLLLSGALESGASVRVDTVDGELDIRAVSGGTADGEAAR